MLDESFFHFCYMHLYEVNGLDATRRNKQIGVPRLDGHVKRDRVAMSKTLRAYPALLAFPFTFYYRPLKRKKLRGKTKSYSTTLTVTAPHAMLNLSSQFLPFFASLITYKAWGEPILRH